VTGVTPEPYAVSTTLASLDLLNIVFQFHPESSIFAKEKD
jgi:hypothetical protein